MSNTGTTNDNGFLKKYSKEVEALITKFDQLQEERVKTYRIFEQGNKDYLSSGPEYDFISYRDIVNNVTCAFKRISEEIIEIEKTLRLADVTEIADIIAAVQDCEKQKLELTVEHHLARQMAQDSNNELEKSTERKIRQKLGDIIEEINDNLSELRYIMYDDVS